MSHTPQPWITEATGTHFYTDRYRTIVDVPQPNDMPEAEWLANKALISAAPDLLAALRAIMEDVDVHNRGGWAKAMKMAEAAIARAEGKT